MKSLTEVQAEHRPRQVVKATIHREAAYTCVGPDCLVCDVPWPAFAAHVSSVWEEERTISTFEERDALPCGAVVLDAFAASCTRIIETEVFGWVRATSAVWKGWHYHEPFLPATVLYLPEEAWEAAGGVS